jgi:type IV pilus assembly protein PilB
MRRKTAVAAEAIPQDEESALIELANKIIQAAVADDASDIHIEPARDRTWVRFRIDGVMHEVLSLPRKVHDPLVTRFKTMADLDTASRRTLQGGRFIASVEEGEYDTRETVLPTIWGEKVVLRMWGEEHARLTLDQMRFGKPDRERLERCLHAPTGLLVFSGPTGCGKTTVMHAAMLSLVGPEKTLYSIEDPVEIRLPGITQISLNRKLGIDYPEALGGIVHADPDVVMVGDVPDADTAKATLEAAITGHLVMTTVHADNSALAVQRLVHIGADPFLLAQGLLMVSSQRLVRRICNECRGEIEYAEAAVKELVTRGQNEGMPWPGEHPTLYKGHGCDHCHGTGYYGRMGVYEIMVVDRVMNQQLAELIRAGAEASQLREAAVKRGMTTMFADGMSKAIAGETTVEEVMRVLAL